MALLPRNTANLPNGVRTCKHRAHGGLGPTPYMCHLSRRMCAFPQQEESCVPLVRWCVSAAWRNACVQRECALSNASGRRRPGGASQVCRTVRCRTASISATMCAMLRKDKARRARLQRYRFNTARWRSGDHQRMDVIRTRSQKQCAGLACVHSDAKRAMEETRLGTAMY